MDLEEQDYCLLVYCAASRRSLCRCLVISHLKTYSKHVTHIVWL